MTSHRPAPSLSPEEREDVACELCGSSARTTLLTLPPYGYHACAGCGHVYLSPRPRPAVLPRLYQDYFSAEVPRIEAWRRMMARVYRTAIRLLREAGVPAEGRVLDVGAGYGFFLDALRDQGFSAHGVEPSRTACEFARRWLGVDPACVTLEEWDGPVAAFDALTAFYVIEHVPDPKALLAQAHRLLRPGGILLLRWPHTTPLVKAVSWSGARPDWYDPPWHLRDFSPRTLAALLKGAGFGEVRTLAGGWTVPPEWIARWSSRAAGALSAVLEAVSGGAVTLPGASKTTLARKA